MGLCGAAVLLAVAAPALAQGAGSYPSRPIRVVVPYPPSGGNDIIARLATDELTRRLGQQVVVDNRPGGSTTVGAEIVAKAAPDGYTLLATSHTTFAIMPNLRPKLPYDARKDFAPVALLASQSFVLVLHPAVPATTVKQLIALAKAQPGQLTFASAGVGTGTHFSGEQLKVLAGIDLRHIPYKGTGPALNDLMGGHVSMGFASVAASGGFAKQGRLRMVAVTGAKRSSAAPEVPTIGESVPGYEMTPWNALFAPRGTPPAIIERLNKELVVGFQSPEMKARLAPLGYDQEASTPQQLADHIRVELVRYEKLIKATGFKDE